MVGSYSYRQETENGAVTEEYHVVKQRSIKPVPKPRRVSSVEINNHSNNRAESFKSTGVAEILHIENEDGGEKVTETVLHIYEQQTCQDNFLGNSQVRVQGVSTCGRPATSDTGFLSSSHDFEMETGRPTTASESISKWRADSIMPLPSVFPIPLLKAIGGPTDKLINTQGNPLSKPVKTMSSKPKVKKILVRQSMTPDKKRKWTNAEVPDNHKKGKPALSSAASLRKIYGFRPKMVKNLIKQKKKQQGNGDGSVMSPNSKLPGNTVKFNIENQNELSPVKEVNVSENKNKMSGPLAKFELDVGTPAEAEVKGSPKRQRSMQQERRIDREIPDLSASMSLPALNSSSSIINEYVEHWLEKAQPDPTVYPEEENQTLQTGAERTVSEEYCTLEEKTQVLSSPSMEKTTFPSSLFEKGATQSTPSLENTEALPPHPSSAKTPSLRETSLQKSATIPSVENPLHENIPIPTQLSVEHKLSNSLSLENNSLPVTISVDKPMLSDSPPVENTPIKKSIENMPPSNNISFEKPSLPAQSPLSRLPSEDRPSMSSASEEALSPPVDSLDKTTSSNHSPLKETPLPRNPSMKKARLVSNLSLEKKMTLRRASLEKSAITSDRPLENTISSTPINISVEKTPLSTSDGSSLASSPKCTSPSSVVSEDRPLSIPASEETTSPTGHSNEETLSNQASSNSSNLKVTLSPNKPSVKRTQLGHGNLSLEKKKRPLRKAYSEKSELPREPTSENAQALSSPTLERTPLRRNRSLKTSTTHSSPSLEKNPSPDLTRKKTAAGSLLSEKVRAPRDPLSPKKLSPYAQSLQAVSPPMKPKLKQISLSRHKSLDTTAGRGNVDLKKTPLTRNSRQTLSSSKSMPLSLKKKTPGPNDSDKSKSRNSTPNTAVSSEKRESTTDEGQVRSEERESTPCNSEEEQISYAKKRYSFEKEHVSLEKHMQEEGFTEYQEHYIEEETSEEDANYEMTDEKPTVDLKKTQTQSVAERVSLLEKQVAVVDQRNNLIMETSGTKQFAQMEAAYTSDCDDLTYVSHLSNEQVQVDEFMRGTSETTTHHHIRDGINRDKRPVNTSESSVMAKRSTLKSSSLAFSYDSNRYLSIEPDGNRVKSIKEMFLAKSVVDIGQRTLPSPNTSDLSDSRPETSDSAGHRTSTELFSGEDESFYKAIAKGFVRRTIEMLYGKRETEVRAHDSGRPPTAPKLTLAALSPFTMPRPRVKVKSDVSYLNATSPLETHSEQTRCMAFDAQVGPADSVPIDILIENNQIRKSISEPIGMNKNTETPADIEDACEDTKEKVPYSVFGPEPPHTVVSPGPEEDIVKPVAPACTYLNLRHGSDSDLGQDELRPVSSSGQADVSVKDNEDAAEDSKTWAEKNGTLPGCALTEFKMLDNKVHPLVEGPEEGPVVLVQPGKGQQKQTVNKTTVTKVTAHRRQQEPDAIEMLYVFCGQYCPVL